jgi:hypothetical protein
VHLNGYLTPGGRIPSSVSGIVSMGLSMIPTSIQFMADPETARLLEEISQGTGKTPSEILPLLLSSPRVRAALEEDIKGGKIVPFDDGDVDLAFE